MKCGFCGFEFDPNEAHAACASCPLSAGGCGMVRCPRCNYEMPPEAKLIGWLRGLKERWQSRSDAKRQPAQGSR